MNPQTDVLWIAAALDSLQFVIFYVLLITITGWSGVTRKTNTRDSEISLSSYLGEKYNNLTSPKKGKPHDEL